MPYYIYRVKPFGQLDKLEEHGAFAAASSQAKTLRAALPSGTPDKVKVIFAENELQAEDLLCQVREAGPTGEE
ncbi:hypothetical protein [Hydrogenophaga sp.]|uniref:hypothetical protein n=1 Tax=Hydrogenophaga sp. TaxID=1904254 RepID=UPI00272F781D|nr:hypothetical protein [Hydrogenophaga sp.]MDP2405607.1 hypothetical protein [Hydrogenophaga sp.]MDP3885906.1 hypothetical protein [Hydrogenophaga sp.]MDZ4173682.1 hypothetical protein [Hydrogenophaga sp.]